ncbi:MAG: hypothetical protein R3F59_03445 [Myxococcota bacterium]
MYGKAQAPRAQQTQDPALDEGPDALPDLGSNAARAARLGLAAERRDEPFVRDLADNPWWSDPGDDPPPTDPTSARAAVLAHRARGDADAPAAVDALGVLAGDRAWPQLASAEAYVVLGRTQVPLEVHRWADAIASLPADARAAHAALLARSASGRTLSAWLAEARAAADPSLDPAQDAVAAVRAFRTAGAPTHPSAIAALRALFALGWDEARIEAAVQERAEDEIDLQALTPQARAAYDLARAAGRASTGGSPPAPRRHLRSRRPPGPQGAAIQAVAGGGAGATSIAPVALTRADVGDVLAAQLNARVAEALLANVGVDGALARWIATAPPATVLPLVDPTPSDATTGGYRGYAIRDTGGALVPGERLAEALDSGLYRVGLNAAFYDQVVVPLLRDPQVLAMARADLGAGELDAEIDATLAELGSDAGAWTPEQQARMSALFARRDALRRLGSDLRTGATSYTALLGRQLDVAARLDQAVADADRRIAEATEALAARRRDMATVRGLPVMDPMDRRAAPRLDDQDEQRRLASLQQWRTDLVAQRRSLELLLLNPYAVTVEADLKAVEALAEKPPDFVTRGQGILLAAKAAATESWAMVGRIDAGLGCIPGLLDPENRLGGRDLSDELYRRAMSHVREYEEQAAVDTQRASTALGTVGTEVVKFLTSTVIVGVATMGLGASGSAVFRAGSVAARLTSAAVTTTVGGLSQTGNGAGAMLWGGVSMGLLPLAGAFGKSGATRLLSAFTMGALTDGMAQVDVEAAARSWMLEQDVGKAVRTAVRSVSVERMLFNGILGVLVEAATLSLEAPGTAGGAGPPPTGSARRATSSTSRSLRLRRQGDAEGLGEMVASRARIDARLKVLETVELGQPIPQDLVDAAGGPPEGYVRDPAGQQWVYDEATAKAQAAAREHQLTLARDYRAALDETDAAWAELQRLRRRNAPPEELSAQRLKIGQASERSAAKLDALQAELGRSTTPLETPAAPVPVGARLGGGGEGVVYEIDTPDGPLAAKVPVEGVSVEQLQKGVLPATYGGVGQSGIGRVVRDGETVNALMMPKIEGAPLSKGPPVTADALESFERFVDAMRRDGVVLGDMNFGNVLVGSDRVWFIDQQPATRATYGALMRKTLGRELTAAEIDADWQIAVQRFERNVAAARAELEGRATRRTTLPEVRRTSSPARVAAEEAEIVDLAKRTEDWSENCTSPTCMTAAMKSTASARGSGLEAYVFKFRGKSRRTGLDAGHAITAIRRSDGRIRYLSWGRVYDRWEDVANEVFTDAYLTGVFELTEHVTWVTDRKLTYRTPDDP